MKLAAAVLLSLGLLAPARAAAEAAPVAPGAVAPKPLFRDPVFDGAADPVVVWNPHVRRWWMFYTNRRANAPGLSGVAWVHGTRIGIAESADGGAHWTYVGTAGITLPADVGGAEPTLWAPEVRTGPDGVHHMYLAVVPGVFEDWQHPRTIVHLTSADMRDWTYQSSLRLASDRVIDPCTFPLPGGGWRMWYNDERDNKSICYADSADLSAWVDHGRCDGVGARPGEGPFVFMWRGRYWMLVDHWKGLGVYRSDDLLHWTGQPDDILGVPGHGADDGVNGGHPGVVVSGDRALCFYFTHPGRAGTISPQDKDSLALRRSSIQVVELREKDGRISCDRDEPTHVDLRAPADAAAVPPDASGAAVPGLVQKIRDELAGPPTEDSKPNPAVPHGELVEGTLADSRIYPGAESAFKVYVPAQYSPDHPACLLVRLDGLGADDATVFDNLIAKGDMPVTVAVGLSSSVNWKTKGTAAYRWNRSLEFDSTNGNFPDFVMTELLPRVETLATRDGRPIHLSHDARDRAVMGVSTGGIGSFTLAWQRPDSFSRVYSIIGTFVSMRGGSDYPAIIRKTEPKPIRIFLEDGSTDAWNPLFGSWFMANENMEAALSFAGFDVQHAWGVHGHAAGPGYVILPDVMRWLWQGWPAAIQAGQSRNDMLASILRPGEGWELVADGINAAAGLASNPQGEVFYSDAQSHDIYRVGADGKAAVFSRNAPPMGGGAFGPDGTLYATAPAEGEILAFDSGGIARKVADGIRGGRILVTAGSDIYVSEPGGHSDEPGVVWRIRPDGSKTAVDRGLLSGSGIAFSPDKALFFAAERTTKWIYSYLAQPDGTLQDREAYYWLHMADIPNESGAGDIAVDLQGNLYAATRLGVQVCDRGGRVRAILWLPTPCGPVQGICWGGTGFDTLYATDGRRLFKRHLKIPGYPQWSAPVVLPAGNAA